MLENNIQWQAYAKKKASHISQIRESGNGDISLTVAIYDRISSTSIFFSTAAIDPAAPIFHVSPPNRPSNHI